MLAGDTAQKGTAQAGKAVNKTTGTAGKAVNKTTDTAGSGVNKTVGSATGTSVPVAFNMGGQPDEIAQAVVWLCRRESASITGQAIAVAGGEVM